MPGASCVPTAPRNGAVPSAPQLLGAARIHPDIRAGMPLRPAPSGRQEGTDNKAGARQAATRLVSTRRQDHPPRTGIVTADRLRAHAPPLETWHHHALHALLGVQEGEHAFWFQHGQAAEHAGRGTSSERHDRAPGGGHRLRLVHAGPLQASNVDGRVHGMAYGERGPNKGPHVSGVTDLRVRRRQVFPLRRGGRARWKMANETLQTLQNQGDTCAHHDGPGPPQLAVVCATVLRLALVVAQTPPLCGALWPAVWAQLGSKRLRWERMRAWFAAEALTAMGPLCAALFSGCTTSRPLVGSDASSSPSLAAVTSCPPTRGSPMLGGSWRLQEATRLPSTRHLVTSKRKSRRKRRQWLVGTLTELSARMVA
jgi:hypothetical protein